MSDIRFRCKKCQGKFVIDSRAMGREVACPACKEVITIPLRDDDPEESAPSLQSGPAAQPAGSEGNTCTRCGKEVILKTSELVSKCRAVGMILNWGSMGPTINDGSTTATGLNDIYDILNRGSQEKMQSFQSIIGSWAPHGRCAKCGEQWCRQCINGLLPNNSMKRPPHCKCA